MKDKSKLDSGFIFMMSELVETVHTKDQLLSQLETLEKAIAASAKHYEEQQIEVMVVISKEVLQRKCEQLLATYLEKTGRLGKTLHRPFDDAFEEVFKMQQRIDESQQQHHSEAMFDILTDLIHNN